MADSKKDEPLKDCTHLGGNEAGEQVWKTPGGARFIVKDGVTEILRYWTRGYSPRLGNRRFMTAAEVQAAGFASAP